MTPVQLPEVPVHSYGFNPGESEASHAFRFCRTDTHQAPLYTAAQLREYATEAVMEERARISALADSWRSDAAWLESTPMADTPGGDLQARTFRQLADDLTELLTPSETNSER